MSILSSIKNWLETFDGMDLRPIADVTTDIVDNRVGAQAIKPSGNSTIHTDILGGRTYQNSYVFNCREHTDDELTRRDTVDFLESLTEWVDEQNDSGNLPVLSGRYKSKEVSVANAILMDIYEDGTGLYQVQIQLIFEKR